jgi:DNA-binding XRE family transcriptional regulator|tara:strand:+ start:1428 stop:1664 length:237 start_codon:yes stop_codon:yes gene_type:complete
MSYGYTTRLSTMNKQADGSLSGVKLGRVCIRKEVPVAEVALQLGVSRQTVYNWFTGAHEPNEDLKDAVKILIAEYRRQ